MFCEFVFWPSYLAAFQLTVSRSLGIRLDLKTIKFNDMNWDGAFLTGTNAGKLTFMLVQHLVTPTESSHRITTKPVKQPIHFIAVQLMTLRNLAK